VRPWGWEADDRVVDTALASRADAFRRVAQGLAVVRANLEAGAHTRQVFSST